VDKRLTTLFLATTTVIALAGCGSPSPDTNQPLSATLPCLESGESSNAIAVTGEKNAEPTVTFAAPLTVEKMQRTVVTAGDGSAIQPNDTITVAFAIYDATTGNKVAANGFQNPGGETLSTSEDKALAGIINKNVSCSTAGSRIALAVPANDVAAAFPGMDLKEVTGHALAIVLDIKSVVPKRAAGATQAPHEGFPTVTRADNGAPTVTIPPIDPPTDLKTEVLIKGDGPIVTEGATITAHYQGLIWGTGTIFDQTWDKHGPMALNLGGVVKGFSQGLVGQTVGSQVVVVVPPALGYGESGNVAAGIKGTDTIIFVVDILTTS